MIFIKLNDFHGGKVSQNVYIILLQTALLFANLYFLTRHAKGLSKVIPASGTFLSLIAIFGPSVWNWARTAAGPGLLGFWALSPNEISQFRIIMLCYVSGVSLGNVYLINMKRKPMRMREPLLKQGRGNLYRFSYFGLILYFIGQGTSIFYRDTYLVTNGILTIQRLSSTVLLPLLAVSIYLVATSKSRKELAPAITLQLIWSVCLLGAGSRTAVISISSLLLVLAIRMKHKYLKSASLLFLLTLVAPIVFGASQYARGQSLGISRIPHLLGEQLQLFSESEIQYLIQSFKTMVASVLTCVPILANSPQYSTFGMLLQNFNPLIGSGTDATLISSDYSERLFPYVWVPLATAGQLYGGLGPLGAMLFVSVLSLITGRILTRSTSSTFQSLIQLLASGTFTALMLLGIQYPSRMWLRLSWTLILLWPVSYFIHSMRSANQLSGFQQEAKAVPCDGENQSEFSNFQSNDRQAVI